MDREAFMGRRATPLCLSALTLVALLATHGLAEAQGRDFSKVEIRTDKVFAIVYAGLPLPCADYWPGISPAAAP